MGFHPDVHVVHVREFTAASVLRFARRFEALEDHGQPAIPVIIDSYGGSSYACRAMIDIIEAAKARGVVVPTVVRGKAMSAGALLFASGSKGLRYVGQNSTIMVHAASSWSEGKAHEMKATASEVERLTAQYWRTLDKAAGKRGGYFERLSAKVKNADLYLTADECVEHGLADHVGIPQFKGVANVVVL